MCGRLLNEEDGYSLVEVMASIMILAIAIIPMVGMFDMGLQTATRSGNYETARAFANTKLEQAKSLSYTQTRDNFPRPGDTTPSSSPPATINASAEGAPGFSYSVTKRYLTPPAVDSTSTSGTLTPGGTTDTGIIQLTVTVSWQNNSYSTTGAVAKDAL